MHPKFFKHLLLIGSLMGIGLGSCAAQQIVTSAGGYTTFHLARGFNPVGQSFYRPHVARGIIQSEEGAVIIDDTKNFLTLLDDPAVTYLLEVTSGPQLGAVAEIIDSSITANSFGIGGSLEAGVGNTYQIRPATTLNEMFGASFAPLAPVFLPDENTDTIWLQDGEGGFEQYFFCQSGGEFRSANAPFLSPEKPYHVFYPDGFFLELRSQEFMSIIHVGLVKTFGTVASLRLGFNLIGGLAPLGTTLGSMGLESFLEGTPVFPGATTDLVWISDRTSPTGFRQYFYNTSAEEWRKVDSAFGDDQSETPVAGAIFIQRLSFAGSISELIQVPDFYSTL